MHIINIYWKAMEEFQMIAIIDYDCYYEGKTTVK